MNAQPEVWQDTVNDPRGTIESLCDQPVGDITRIFSKAGSVRSNHYHKTDWHILYVVSGKMLLYERPAGSGDIPKMRVLEAGEYAYTGPMVEHTTLFPQDTTLLCFSGNRRGKDAYEDDLVRCENLHALIRSGHFHRV